MEHISIHIQMHIVLLNNAYFLHINGESIFIFLYRI